MENNKYQRTINQEALSQIYQLFYVNVLSKTNKIYLTGSYALKLFVDPYPQLFPRKTVDLDFIIDEQNTKMEGLTTKIQNLLLNYCGPHNEYICDRNGNQAQKIKTKVLNSGNIRIKIQLFFPERQEMSNLLHIDIQPSERSLVNDTFPLVHPLYLLTTKTMTSLTFPDTRRSKDIIDIYVLLETVFANGVKKETIYNEIHRGNWRNARYSNKWYETKTVENYAKNMVKQNADIFNVGTPLTLEECRLIAEIISYFIKGLLSSKISNQSVFYHHHWR